MLGGGGNQTKILPKKSRYKTPPTPKPFGGKRPKAVRTVPAFPPPGPSLAPLCLAPALSPGTVQGGQRAGLQPVARGHPCGGTVTSLWWHGDIPEVARGHPWPCPAPALTRSSDTWASSCHHVPGELLCSGAAPGRLLGSASLPSILPHLRWCRVLLRARGDRRFRLLAAHALPARRDSRGEFEPFHPVNDVPWGALQQTPSVPSLGCVWHSQHPRRARLE